MTFPVTSTASIGTGVTAGTTAVPPQTDMTVIGVVIALILLTLVVVGVLLYRYLCHSKGFTEPQVNPLQEWTQTRSTMTPSPKTRRNTSSEPFSIRMDLTNDQNAWTAADI